jgi:hypothetical protein
MKGSSSAWTVGIDLIDLADVSSGLFISMLW